MTEDSHTAIHRYPLGAVIADYARALVGMAMTFGPLAFVNIGSVMVYILAGLGALFLLFGCRTVLRHLTKVEVSAGGIRIAGSGGQAVRWCDLDHMSLRYYTIRRDKSGGWMQLKIKEKGSDVTLDSSLEGFDDIVRRALEAARANEIALESGTLTNLPAMGIDAPSDIDATSDIDAPSDIDATSTGAR